MPTLEIRLEPFPGKLSRPRFLGNFIGLHEPDEVEHRAGAQVIGYDMPPGPHPNHHDRFHEILGQAFDWDGNAPGGIARVGRGNISVDLLADDGLETVRSDQQVTLDNRAVGKTQLNAVAALFESNDPAVQSNGVTFEFKHLRREQSVNISAVNLVIRRTVQLLMLIGQRKSLNLFTGVMEPEDVGPRSNDNAFYKAYSAASLTLSRKEDSTKAVADRISKNPPSTVPQTPLPNITYATGGVTIMVGGVAIGTIGVSGAPGGQFDEQCAREAISKIQDRMK
jgi:uncharacterized protein GlcG (DUF336 family)